MMRVAQEADLSGWEKLGFTDTTPIDEIWSETSKACLVAPEDLARAISRTFHMPVADLAAAEPTAAKLVPPGVAQKYCVFPIRSRDRHLILASADPTNFEAEEEITFNSGRTPVMHVAPPGAITDAINATYSSDRLAESILAGVGLQMDHMSEVLEVLEEEDQPELISAAETGSGPIVRLTNMIFHEAIERGSSDIHIQPTPTVGVVRYRVDGVLRPGMQMPLAVTTRVVSRIKIMSRLDISDRLRPQDGRARIVMYGKKYDLRVSTVPTRHAEKAVIRILDPHQTGALDDTGIQAGELERIRSVLSSRDGIFVATGPTGSGKTTTLYASLREIATEGVNIMTVEDPIEYELPGLTQIQVEPRQGVSFASALRAILRQDPDVIFIGEIRDNETVDIAAQASLTGHLVLATLHTNDAVGSIRRFADLGLDVSTIMETLRGALAQRLVRKVCTHCAEPVTDPLTEEEEKGVRRFGVRPKVRAIGCEICGSSGYLGRLPVTEFMIVTPELAQLALDQAPPYELQKQARADGMVALHESALARVDAGETTLEEVARVVGFARVEASRDAKPTAGASPAGASPVGTEVVTPPEVGDAPLPTEASPVALPPPASAPEPVPSQPPSQRVPLGAVPPHADDLDDDTPHILVVDDDEGTRKLARAVLEMQKYRVSEAADGSQALVRIASGEVFSLMVLDLDMPVLGGRDVLRAVRTSVLAAGLPVVVLTGTRDPEAEIQLLEAGADDYIRKPLEPASFLTRIKAALRRAGA